MPLPSAPPSPTAPPPSAAAVPSTLVDDSTVVDAEGDVPVQKSVSSSKVDVSLRLVDSHVFQGEQLCGELTIVVKEKIENCDLSLQVKGSEEAHWRTSTSNKDGNNTYHHHHRSAVCLDTTSSVFQGRSLAPGTYTVLFGGDSVLVPCIECQQPGVALPLDKNAAACALVVPGSLAASMSAPATEPGCCPKCQCPAQAPRDATLVHVPPLPADCKASVRVRHNDDDQHRVSIQYGITVHINFKGFLFFGKKKVNCGAPFEVRNCAYTSPEHPLLAPATKREDLPVYWCCCCFKIGDIGASITLERTMFSRAGRCLTAWASMAVQNHSKRAVNRVTFWLAQEASTSHNQSSQQVASQQYSVPVAPFTDVNVQVLLQLPLTDLGAPTVGGGGLVHVSYSIVVTFDVSWMVDPVITFPVMVLDALLGKLPKGTALPQEAVPSYDGASAGGYVGYGGCGGGGGRDNCGYGSSGEAGAGDGTGGVYRYGGNGDSNRCRANGASVTVGN